MAKMIELNAVVNELTGYNLKEDYKNEYEKNR